MRPFKSVKVSVMVETIQNTQLRWVEPVPSEPRVFLKPSSVIVPTGESVVLPQRSNDVHHEVELVVLIGAQGKNIPADRSLDIVAGYAVGLDMTARDLQAAAKAARSPWSIAKGL